MEELTMKKIIEQYFSRLSNIIFSEQNKNLTKISSYFARQEIEKIYKDISAKSKLRLEPYGFKVYSQGDEDGIIEEICKRLNIDKGIFCEFGVENGLENNTLYLLHKGWSGIWFEAKASYVEFINKKFHHVIKTGKLIVKRKFITPDNINKLLKETLKDKELVFLSIDINGMDIYILESLKLRPKIICIEYNSKFPSNLSKKIKFDPNFVWQGTDYFGASLKAICEVANQKGYKLVGTNIIGSNAFYVRDDLWNENIFPSPPDPEHLYNPPRYYLLDHYFNIGHPADFGEYDDL